MELICELATSHGGDVALACDMVQAAADSGAHTVKIQSYTLARLNPTDPQYDWLVKARLDDRGHDFVIQACARAKVQFLSTPFDREALLLLKTLGVRRSKMASSEAIQSWWRTPPREVPEMHWLVSWPWGQRPPMRTDWYDLIDAELTAIPLYPTPLECLSAVTLLDGYSDHCEGTAACKHMISRGATIIEAHMCLPGRSRQTSWDKVPAQLREIRDWMDQVATMTTGVSQTYRERWSA